MSNIEQRVIKVVAKQLGKVTTEIQLEHDLKEDLGADSLDSVELVMAIEDEFEIEVDDDAAEKLTTVHSIVDYLTPRVALAK